MKSRGTPPSHVGHAIAAMVLNRLPSSVRDTLCGAGVVVTNAPPGAKYAGLCVYRDGSDRPYASIMAWNFGEGG